MGLTGVVRRMAAWSAVPVLVAPGVGGRDAAQWLPLRHELDVVSSPRHATVLLVVGDVPDGALAALLAVHDQLPHPRGVLWWDVRGSSKPPVPDWVRLSGEVESVVVALVHLHRGLVTGEMPTSPAALPDVDPNPWRGIGPFGQGGKGMTGGTPYGRPLSGRAPDRDGLELDQLSVRLGPWLSMLPPGLILDVLVQGDVVQSATVASSPFAGSNHRTRPGFGSNVFVRAQSEAVPIGELELARARHHLTWAAELLRLVGLRAESRRVLRGAHALVPGATPATLDTARGMAVSLASARRLRRPLAGVGVLDAGKAGAIGGPVARASGTVSDARVDDPAYQSLDFEPASEDCGDALARWLVRLHETIDSLGLVVRSQEEVTTLGLPVEGPRGPLSADGRSPSARLAALAPPLLTGLEWGDAVVALASLDLDPSEFVVEAMAPEAVT